MKMPLRLSVLGDLFKQYANVITFSWRHRKETDVKQREPYELAFLPHHLEVIETPVHPLPYWITWVITIMVILTLLIAYFGKLDIVATAPGSFVPVSNVKVIQPAANGVIRQILVQSGQRVEKGQLLMELDPTTAAAEFNKAADTLTEAQLASSRAKALLAAQQSGHVPHLDPVTGIAPDRYTEAQHLAESAYSVYAAKIQSMRNDVQRMHIEMQDTEQSVSHLKESVPLLSKQVSDYKDLVKDHYVSEHDYQDKQRALIEQQQNLDSQQSRVHELQAQIAKQESDIQSAEAAFKKEQLDNLNDSQQRTSIADNDKDRTEVQKSQTELRAPVAGIVQKLNLSTIGGVVTNAQEVMEIVPDDQLEVALNISNKDIGFVHPGQDVIIKIETFPYTKYGYITGKLKKVANSATQKDKTEPYFEARASIPSNQFKVDGKWITLTPGMQVSAEIKTGERKVWQYFLSPLIQTGQQSLNER